MEILEVGLSRVGYQFIYGDKAYAVKDQILSLHCGAHVTELQKLFDTALSKVRNSVEWVLE